MMNLRILCLRLILYFFCILDFFITFSTINYQYGFFYDFYLTFEYILYCYNASFYLKLNCILKYISF